MQNSKAIDSECFICRQKKSQRKKLSLVEKGKVPGSQKPILDVIMHVSGVMNWNIAVPAKAKLCQSCNEHLVEYDSLVLRLESIQNHLTQLVEKWHSPDSVNICDDECLLDIANITTSEMNTSDLQDVEPICSIQIDKISGDDESIAMNFLGTNEIKEDEEPIAMNFLDTNEIKEDEEPIAMNFLDTNEITNGSCADVDIQMDIKYEIPVVDIQVEPADVKPKKKPATCVHCNKSFQKKTQLKYHIKTEHKRKNRICSLCGIVAKNEEYLELHMNVHEGKSEKECRYCSKTYTCKMNVIRHMQKHWDKKTYQCEKCGVRFSERPLMYNHMLQHAAEEKPLICHICYQSFKTKRTYRGHLVKHRVDRPRFACQYCEKTFFEKYTLNVHLRTHAEGNVGSISPVRARRKKQKKIKIESITCIICSCELKGKEQYEQHMKQEHDVILSTED